MQVSCYPVCAVRHPACAVVGGCRADCRRTVAQCLAVNVIVTADCHSLAVTQFCQRHYGYVIADTQGWHDAVMMYDRWCCEHVTANYSL